MSDSKYTLKRMGEVVLFLLLISPIPIMGQFMLPFLYIPLKRIFPGDFSSDLYPKYNKVTPQHTRTANHWSLEYTYSQTMNEIKRQAVFFVSDSAVSVSHLADLDYYWSYDISFNSIASSYSDSSLVPQLKPAEFQEELLQFVSQKFILNLDNVASILSIPTVNLSWSYDPANWEAVVHAMVNESTSAFSKLLELHSVNTLAELVVMQTQEFLNVNLNRFEELVFPFLPKKAIIDINITSYLISSSGIIPGDSYSDLTVAKILQQHENISLSAKEFGILYNLTTEQAKAIGRATFYQILCMCGISSETLLDITLPEVSWKVVGSMFITPPCPVVIAINGKSIASFENVINPQNTAVLEILSMVSNLTWRSVYQAVNASLPDWEFFDSVTLQQLAEISGVSLDTLLNDSVSEAAMLVFRMRADGTLNNETEAHRTVIRNLLEEKFNLTLNEVANLTGIPEGSLQDASSPWLFRSFLNATITYFELTLSEIITSVQVSEEELHNLPRQEWESVIASIVDPVVKSEAADLQMSVAKLRQYLGVQSVELSITQLKELMKNQILHAKQKKRKFETDPISLHLSQNYVSDEAYFNSTVLSLVMSASGFSSDELKLVYEYNSDEMFILGSMRISDVPHYCALNTSAIKDRTPYNITEELVGMKEAPAVCISTMFYLAARTKNMSVLQTEFSPFTNSTISFVKLVEMVTGLPWRRNVWAFGITKEAWTVLYVLSEDAYKEVTTGLDPYLSRTLVQIFEKSLELQDANNVNLRAKIQGSRAPTLNNIYDLFNTNEEELMHFGSKTKAQYDVLLPIEVFSLVIQYLVGKFNVSVSSLEASLDLNPGELDKLSPTEWPEMIPFVKTEVIRSGQYQLSVTLSNFAQLLQETPESLQSLTLVRLESKWNSIFSRLLKGKAAIETETILQITTSIGVTSNSLDDVTILEFIEDKVNLTKSEVLLLYNYSSIGIDVLGNYTFVELLGFCELSKVDLFNKLPHEIIVSLLGYDNDMACRKIASITAAATITVNELAAAFSFQVNDNVRLLTMFEDLFKLPWPKIAWAVNASLPDWPILGAVNLNDVAQLTSETTANIKSQQSYREITAQLLSLPENSYTQLINAYRGILVSEAANLFSVNSSQICDNCNLVDILRNSLTQLNLLINFDPQMLPNELNVSPYEFNLAVPSHWPQMVQPIVRDAYSKAAMALGMDRNRLSTLLQISTAAVENMTLSQYQALVTQSIQLFMVAKTALNNTPLSDLIAARGLNLSALYNESIFDVIDAILSVPVQNVSFIFNWTAEQQAKLKRYTLDDMAYYRGLGLQDLGNERLLPLLEYIIQESLPPRTFTPPTPPPCKRGSTRVGNDAECTDIDECASKICGDDSLCKNYRGGFDCECNVPAHFKVNINGKCQPCKTFIGTLTITNHEYRSSLDNKFTEDSFDMKDNIEGTINEEAKKSPLKQVYLGCRVQNYRSGSLIVDLLIYMSPDFTGTLQDIQDALTSRVNNSYLGPFEVITSEISVEDFDECKAHRDNCGQDATCVNKEGSFECKCNDGYDGDGLTCEAQFFKTMWWTVVVAAFLLLIIVIIIVCLVIKRPKPTARYGLDINEPTQSNQPNRRQSEASKTTYLSSRRLSDASKVSYRSGDVYYKDKDGKLTPGAAHNPNMLEIGTDGVEDRPHTPHFVAEDEFQIDNDLRGKTPFELAVERNTRSDSFKYGSCAEGKTPFELAVERNARNGNDYQQTEDLNMTVLPIASMET